MCWHCPSQWPSVTSTSCPIGLLRKEAKVPEDLEWVADPQMTDLTHLSGIQLANIPCCILALIYCPVIITTTTIICSMLEYWCAICSRFSLVLIELPLIVVVTFVSYPGLLGRHSRYLEMCSCDSFEMEFLSLHCEISFPVPELATLSRGSMTYSHCSEVTPHAQIFCSGTLYWESNFGERREDLFMDVRKTIIHIFVWENSKCYDT